jgi:hypothetical protein
MPRFDHDTPSDFDATGISQPVSPVLIRCAIYILTISAVFSFINGNSISLYLFRNQDFPTLVLIAGFLLVISNIAGKFDLGFLGRWTEHGPAVLIAATFVVSALGTWLIFDNYAFSRDEVMANFDADILHRGQLMARTATAWVGYTDALVPLFRHAVPGDVALVSNYLPGNAALRALADLTIGRSYVNPVLAAIAALALFGIARLLWPSLRSAPLLVLTLLATSPQFLVTAMTPYSMTAHLACNLLWLWCYLRDDRRGVVAALVVGFVATGLHQLIFHPLFVLPFILDLLIVRRWGRAAAYCVGYAGIAVFWISYWPIASAISDVPSAAGSGIGQIAEVAIALLHNFSFSSILLILCNLLRLVAWQHILLLPLVVLAWPAIRRGEGIARPLAGGIVLTLLAMLLLMPTQGYGWGYRYLHGCLGSLCLLAVYGWQDIVGTERTRLQSMTIAATAFTVLVVLPLDMVFAYWLVRPYRTAYAMIEQSGVPIVLIDATGSMTSQDVLRNAPDLHNRPLIMDIQALGRPQLAALCRRYPLAVFGRREAKTAGIPIGSADDLSGERRNLAALGCRVEHPSAWSRSSTP